MPTGMVYRELGTTGLMASEAGFGSYRVDISVEEHKQALKAALLGGINLIDTSSNYSDGGSEKLIGAVIQELIQEKRVKRESLIVVSKAGYIQGQNYVLSQSRKNEGRPFPELVEYAEGLEHCIHPEFLEDQLTRSLDRLKLKSLDVFLLHNPEYFLSHAEHQGTPLQDARTEYDRRIDHAFRFLETEVEKGRIRFYGVSSNSFPHAAHSTDFSSLESFWKIAEAISNSHHFRVVQFPMNLFETGGRTEINQPGGKSVLEFARTCKIGVLINRPLNAFCNNEMIRLADVEEVEAVNPEDVDRMLNELVKSESELRQVIFPELKIPTQQKKELDEFFSIGAALSRYWKTFGAYHRWRELNGQYFSPMFKLGIQSLLSVKKLPAEATEWLEYYNHKANRSMSLVTRYYQHFSAARVEHIKQAIQKADSEWASAKTLSQMAIRALRSTEGISCVLVGMRKQEYVKDVLEELAQPVHESCKQNSWVSCSQWLKQF